MKNLIIESYRGLAILLVVIGHVIGSSPTGGMKIEYPSIFRDIYLPIDYIQMTLFTFIAGFVYDLHPIESQKIELFIKKKIIRLLLPMFFVSSIYYILQSIIPGTNQNNQLLDIWQIYIIPYSIYWYLFALFWMFTFTIILEKFRFLSSLKSYIVTVVMAIAFMFFIFQEVIPDEIPNLFSFKGTLVYFPSFLVGLGIHRFNKGKSASLLGICCILTIIGIFCICQEHFIQHQLEGISLFVKRFCALGTCYLLLKIKFNNAFFIFIGKYAYSIYLFHVFGTAGARIILKSLNVHNDWIIFIGSTITAVIFPIIIDHILAKKRWLDMMFLGKMNTTLTRNS